MVDVIGMTTVCEVSQYWGTVRQDAQTLANAAYAKERFLDKGLQRMMGGEGFYSFCRYPNPAHAAPGFLAVPEASVAPEIVARVLLTVIE